MGNRISSAFLHYFHGSYEDRSSIYPQSTPSVPVEDVIDSKTLANAVSKIINDQISNIQCKPRSYCAMVGRHKAHFVFMKNVLDHFNESSLSPDRVLKLLDIIGKADDGHSTTGLNLSDAIYIDNFIIEKKLNEFKSSRVRKVKPNQENGLPRSLVVGVIKDVAEKGTESENPSNIIRAMVLCKSKVSPYEIYLKDDTLNLLTIKREPLGIGNDKVAKLALDWFSGQLFAEILMIETEAISFEKVTKTYCYEFNFMKILAGKKGIVQPGFMSFKSVKAANNLFSARQYISYFMPYYKSFDKVLLSEKGQQISFVTLFRRIDNLADSLISYYESDVIHLDIKTQNIFQDSSGTLLIGDHGLSSTKADYIESVNKKEFQLGTLCYNAPEVINSSATGRDIDYLLSPHARDVWACGLVSLETIAYTASSDYSEVFNFQTNLQDIAAISLKAVEKQRWRRQHLLGYVDVDSRVDDLLDSVTTSLFSSWSAEELEKITSLLKIVREMMRADPKDRIDPHTLKWKLQRLLSSD